MIRLGVLSDGEGLGFQDLYDACRAGDLDAAVVALAAERKCPAVHRAEAVRLPIIFHPWGPYKVAGKLRATYDRDLAARLRMHGVELVVLDGWARELTWGIEEMYPGRILDLGAGEPSGAAAADRESVLARVRPALADLPRTPG